MKITAFFYTIVCHLFLITAVIACGQQPGGKKKKAAEKETTAVQEKLPYDLGKPQVFALPDELDEISGISLRDGDPGAIYAEQDEEGKVYRFRLGNEGIDEVVKFGKKGDFEDIQVSGTEVFMLRSDGALYRFPIPQGKELEKDDVTDYKNLLPSGEYEGLYLGGAPGRLSVLCKKCAENNRKQTSVYYLNVLATGLENAGSGKIDVEQIARLAGVEKLKFEPSAFVWHAGLGRWFILSSVNKMLVIADKDLTPVAVYPLDPSLYNQPEGIAFDRQFNLYISNEKGGQRTATLLRIPFRKTP